MPVPAVTPAGRSSVSSGSISASQAPISAVPPTLNLILRFGSVITAQSVTSLPVPAVVGTQIVGGMRRRIGCGSAHSYRAIEPPLLATTPIDLAASIELPPPQPITPSQRSHG